MFGYDEIVFGSNEAARSQHAGIRREAYTATREEAMAVFNLGPQLRLADIDQIALDAWSATWNTQRPGGDTGRRDWPTLVQGFARKAAVLPLAIWYEEDLCALAIGRVLKARHGGMGYAVTLSYVERRPEPPRLPLKRTWTMLIVAAADNYGRALGAQWVRLRSPDRSLVPHYERMGFEIAREEKIVVYYQKEI